MPVVLAIVSALISGTFLWLVWGGGFAYVDHRLRERESRKAKERRARDTDQRERLVPLQNVTDPRDAAVTLMVLVAQLRGVATPEQIAAIEHEMTTVLELSADVPTRLGYARFAAEQVPSAAAGIDGLAPRLRQHLTRAERADLIGMLTRVASIHGGPTEKQQGAIERLERLLSAA